MCQELVEKLSNKQKEIIYSILDNYDKKCGHLVSAGPGAGKTHFITIAIPILLSEEKVHPRNILATTFTKKAADEMNKRLVKNGVDINECRIGTMHSVFYEVLRKDGQSYGGRYKVMMDYEYKEIIKDITGYRNMNWKGVNLTNVDKFISYCKNSLVRPYEVEESNVPLIRNLYNEDFRYQLVYEFFEDEREKKGFITFGDMLIRCWELFSENPYVLDKWRSIYQCIITDEFQDTNKAQYEIIKLLAEPEKKVIVVGDDDQSIYGWRTSDPEYMKIFVKDFDAIIHKLDENYRSVPEILNFTNKIISFNPNRIKGDILPIKKSCMDRPTFIEAEDQDDEANIILDQIKQYVTSGQYNYGDMAILYRTNAQSRAFEETFIKNKIPHRVIGGMTFYDRKEIKDLVSYLRVLIYRDPTNKWAKRVISAPFRYIGSDLIRYAESQMIKNESPTLIDSLKKVARVSNNNCKQNINKMCKLFDECRDMINKGYDPSKILFKIVEDTEYEDYILGSEGSDTSENSRIGNIKEFIRTASRFKDVESLINHIDELKNTRKKRVGKKGEVLLMTGHKAKGLEFPIVFAPTWTESIIPHGRSEDSFEERRVAYVIATRAEYKLHLSSVRNMLVGNGYRRMMRSEYIDDGAEFLEFVYPDDVSAELFPV